MSVHDEFAEVRDEIRTILVTEWDPIGVEDSPEAWGEYDAYLFRIFERVRRGDSSDDLARYLRKLEKSSMGLVSNAAERANRAARRLCELWDEQAS